MKERDSEEHRLPNKEQVQNMLALSSDQRLSIFISTLVDTPDEWDSAMTNPTAWLRARGVELPEGLTATITKELTISKPIDLAIAGKPGPDWTPSELRLTDCRTYYLPVYSRDAEGNITGRTYEKVTICFGFEVVPNILPGWPGPSPI